MLSCVKWGLANVRQGNFSQNDIMTHLDRMT